MDFLPQRGRIRFVLVSPSHPGNIGSAARAIKTMGFDRLYVVSPRHPEYRTDPDAIAFSTHAVDVLQNSVCTETLLEALKDVSFACALSVFWLKPACRRTNMEAPNICRKLWMQPRN